MKILISGTDVYQGATRMQIIAEVDFRQDVTERQKNAILEGMAGHLKEALLEWFDEDNISDATIMTDLEYDKMVKGE